MHSSSKTEATRIVRLAENGVGIGHVGNIAGRSILHQKMLIADGAYAVYGSANGTQHSRDKCFELVTLTSFPGIVANLDDRLRELYSSVTTVTLEEAHRIERDARARPPEP